MDITFITIQKRTRKSKRSGICIYLHEKYQIKSWLNFAYALLKMLINHSTLDYHVTNYHTFSKCL